MKRFIIGVAIALIIGSVIAQWLLSDAGFIYIERGESAISMSLATGLLVFLLAAAALWLSLFLIRVLWLPGRWARTTLVDGAKRRAVRRTNEGFIAYSAGDFKLARKRLLASVSNVDAPVINYLLAARSAQYLGDNTRALELLDEAQLVDSDAHPAVSMVKAEIFQQQGHWEQSIATLRQLPDADNPQALRLLVRAYQQLGDEEAIYELMPQLQKAGVYEDEALHEIRVATIAGMFSNCASRIRKGHAQEGDLDALKNKLKKPDAQSQAAAMNHASALLTLDKPKAAEKVLRPFMKRKVSAQLIELYSRTHGSDPLKQLKTLQGVSCDNRAVMTLALGRLSVRGELWGQAKDFYAQAFDLAPEVQTAKEYANLLRKLNDDQAAAKIEHRAIFGAQS